MKFSTVLLDIDDTLMDFSACADQALRTALQLHDIEITPQLCARYMKINENLWKMFDKKEIDRATVLIRRFEELFAEFGIDRDPVKFEDDYQELLGKFHFFIDGAEEFLTWISKKYPLYIVTNGNTATQRSRISASKVDRFFKKIFISEEIGYQKPDKAFFDHIFQEIGNVSLNETIIIGDTLTSDILGGINAGIHTCWFNYKHKENRTNIIPEFTVYNYEQLKELL